MCVFRAYLSCICRVPGSARQYRDQRGVADDFFMFPRTNQEENLFDEASHKRIGDVDSTPGRTCLFPNANDDWGIDRTLSVSWEMDYEHDQNIIPPSRDIHFFSPAASTCNTDRTENPFGDRPREQIRDANLPLVDIYGDLESPIIPRPVESPDKIVEMDYRNDSPILSGLRAVRKLRKEEKLSTFDKKLCTKKYAPPPQRKKVTSKVLFHHETSSQSTATKYPEHRANQLWDSFIKGLDDQSRKLYLKDDQYKFRRRLRSSNRSAENEDAESSDLIVSTEHGRKQNQGNYQDRIRTNATEENERKFFKCRYSRARKDEAKQDLTSKGNTYDTKTSGATVAVRKYDERNVKENTLRKQTPERDVRKSTRNSVSARPLVSGKARVISVEKVQFTLKDLLKRNK